jgi:hypothetical protein
MVDRLQREVVMLEKSRQGLADERDRAIQHVSRLNLICQQLQQESIYIAGKVGAILKACVQLNDGSLTISTTLLDSVKGQVLVRHDRKVEGTEDKDLIYTLREMTPEEQQQLAQMQGPANVEKAE